MDSHSLVPFINSLGLSHFVSDHTAYTVVAYFRIFEGIVVYQSITRAFLLDSLWLPKVVKFFIGLPRSGSYLNVQLLPVSSCLVI